MDEFCRQVVAAIRSVASEVRWKPGSAVRHLLKRKLRGHLPDDASLEDYERTIHAVLENGDATVYVYRYNDVPYVVIVAIIQNHHWLVMFGLDGVMESAYVVDRPDYYLNKPDFEMFGSLNEVLR